MLYLYIQTFDDFPIYYLEKGAKLKYPISALSIDRGSFSIRMWIWTDMVVQYLI